MSVIPGELLKCIADACKDIKTTRERPAGSFTVREYAESVNISESTALRRISDLVRNGRAARHGVGNFVCYTLVKSS